MDQDQKSNANRTMAEVVIRPLAWILAALAGSGSGCAWVSGLDEFSLEPKPAVVPGTPICVPSEPGWTGDGACGVFVASSGDDSAAGTKAAPLKTLEAAFVRATFGGRTVYVCAERFEEAIEMPGGVTVYGGLDCANGWTWVGETRKTEIIGPPDTVAVRIAGGAVVARLEDVAVEAANAVTPGASSIAVLVDRVSAELVRCELRAGNAAMGTSGATGAEPDGMGIPRAAAGAAGSAGNDACSAATTVLGGAQVVNDCGNGDISVGATGGDGNQTNGSGGDNGQVGTDGLGGAGEPASMSNIWNCGAEPNNTNRGGGNAGANGADGTAGAGALGLGTISASGYSGPTGSAGMPGKPGQGGGGGGGAKGGNNICSGNAPGPGASGGSGGAGGCGGQPGQGGGAGGASIALASINANVTLVGCTLTTAGGGQGGAGGEPQPGGVGGDGAPGGFGAGGSRDACPGGKGGQGGNGGRGGGGLGGHSIGIAHIGAAPSLDGTTITPGDPGAGGIGADVMHNGADGVRAETQAFP